MYAWKYYTEKKRFLEVIYLISSNFTLFNAISTRGLFRLMSSPIYTRICIYTIIYVYKWENIEKSNKTFRFQLLENFSDLNSRGFHDLLIYL